MSEILAGIIHGRHLSPLEEMLVGVFCTAAGVLAVTEQWNSQRLLFGHKPLGLIGALGCYQLCLVAGAVCVNRYFTLVPGICNLPVILTGSAIALAAIVYEQWRTSPPE